MTARRLTLECQGLRLAVTADNAEEVVERLRRYVPLDFTEATDGPVKREFVIHERLLRIDGSVDEATRRGLVGPVEALCSAIELLMAEFSRQYLFVHSGVVARGDQAVLFPGRTHAGKTTVAGAFARAGWTYLSDEFALVDAEGKIGAYPRPPSVRHTWGAVGHREMPEGWLVAPRESRWQLDAVLFLRFDAASGLDVRPLSRAETVLRLLDNTGAAHHDAPFVMDRLVAATEDVRAWEGTRGDVASAFPLLLRLLNAVQDDGNEGT